MQAVIVIVSLIALLSCNTDQTNSQAALMDEIEGSIRLPSSAGPLESYARYYTEYKGSVLGTYTTKIESPRPSDYGCEELQLDGSSKTVACAAPADANPGERRWVQFDDFPIVTGEDCTAIQLQFDLRVRKIKYLECAPPPLY